MKMKNKIKKNAQICGLLNAHPIPEMTRTTGQVMLFIVFRLSVFSFPGVGDLGYATSPFQDKHVSLKSSAASLFKEMCFFFFANVGAHFASSLCSGSD